MNYARHQDVLIEIFARLEADGVPFVFLRNHERYPETISGDVDCLVPKTALHKLAAFARAIDSPTAVLRQMIRKNDDLYLMFYIPADTKRPFLVLEFFTGMIRKGQTLVPFQRVDQYRVAAALGQGLERDAELSYAVLHYALFKGTIPKRYSIPLEAEVGYEKFVAIANSMLGTQVLVSNDLTPERIIQAVQQQYRETFSSVLFLLYVMGNVVWARPKMIGARTFVHPASAPKVLEYADKYHLFRPRFRFLLRNCFFHRHLTSRLIAMLGGLALIADESSPMKLLDVCIFVHKRRA